MFLLNASTVALDKPWQTIITVAACMTLAWFLFTLASNRLYFRKLQNQGLPMPPHNIILGHLPVLVKVVSSMPSDAHPLYLSTMIRKRYPNLGPEFYLDVWPFAPAMLVVGSLEIMHQIAFDHVLKKTEILRRYVRPLTDGFDIVSTDGPFWKKWRAIFNPGFSSAHLMTLVPVIVQEVQVYCQLLDDHVAKQDIFAMKPLTDNLILDVIGQVTLGVRFNCQTTFNQVIHSLRTQIKWFTTGVEMNPLDRFHPFRPLVQWYHGRIVNAYVSKELQKRVEMWRGKSVDNSNNQDSSSDLKRGRTVIDLALKSYAESQPKGNESTTAESPMDPDFQKMCLSQLKIFLFSGHDTTSSALCYHYWVLSQNPSALDKIREEHSSVFGADPSSAASQITQSPHLLNQLPYTNGVIKESLRLFPTVTVSREGEEGFDLIDSSGRIFPTANLTVWPNQHQSHYDPAYWPDAESFLPERWLVGPDHSLYPPKGAWRAFEQGPRGCIAQELAMIEMKIALVLVCRSYRVLPAYDELAAATTKTKNTKTVWPTVLGQKAYQIDQMQPKGDLPVRVEKFDYITASEQK